MILAATLLARSSVSVGVHWYIPICYCPIVFVEWLWLVSISCSSLRSGKKRIFSAALCLSKYLVCAHVSLTPGFYRTAWKSHLSSRIFGSFLCGIAWSEAAVLITRSCLLWCALVPSASYTSTRSTRCQSFHPLNVLRLASPAIWVLGCSSWRLRCKAFLAHTTILWPSIVSLVFVTPRRQMILQF